MLRVARCHGTRPSRGRQISSPKGFHTGGLLTDVPEVQSRKTDSHRLLVGAVRGHGRDEAAVQQRGSRQSIDVAVVSSDTEEGNLTGDSFPIGNTRCERVLDVSFHRLSNLSSVEWPLVAVLTCFLAIDEFERR